MQTRIRSKLRKAGIVSVVLNLLGVTIALAASGDLDTSFGGDGKVSVDISGSLSERAYAVVLQSGGQIVVVGDQWDATDDSSHDLTLVRLEPDGDPDPLFGGGDGIVVEDMAENQLALDVVIDPSTDDILIAGQTCDSSWVCDLIVWKYLSDGSSMDSGFNGGSPVTVDIGLVDNGSLGGLALQTDGKIVIAGILSNGFDYDMVVYRLTEAGALDTTFSGDGIQSISFGSGKYDIAADLLLQGTKIVVVGRSCTSFSAGCNFAAARLKANGNLDTTFSGDGKLTTNFGADDRAISVAKWPDGKIVVAGVRKSTDSKMAVARYNAKGSLDTTFSGDGRQTVSFGDSAEATEVLVINKKIVLAGWGGNGGDADFLVGRLKSSGGLDTSFSLDGKAFASFGVSDERVMAMTRQTSDGTYVLAGGYGAGNLGAFGLVRMLP
jgi:uncharacterized delta-60 repeat protein